MSKGQLEIKPRNECLSVSEFTAFCLFAFKGLNVFAPEEDHSFHSNSSAKKQFQSIKRLTN